MGKFVVKETATGFKFDLKATSGQVIATSDVYTSNATALIQAGVNPRVVQQRLGHSDVQITLNTYTHVLPEMDMEAAEKLDRIILQRAAN